MITSLLVSYIGSLAHDLPQVVMSQVMLYGTEEEIMFQEIFEDDGEGEKVYEVILLKKRHELILLLNQEGFVIEKMKKTLSDEQW
tara:strand:- start:1840 stop:2094 length:255 start_codon:yes stop_codon:yes gene_type:complete